ncbi:MAG: IucA/IucC family C-terminal-domain containing protein [Candidatus Limnocylindria bacterium]
MSATRAPWHRDLEAELEGLGRWIRGRFVAEPSATHEVVPAARYLDRDYLRTAIERGKFTTMSPPINVDGEDVDVDLRIAVSRFTRQYASSVTAVALTALGRGVGLDAGVDRCRMIVRANIPFLVVMDTRDPIRSAERPTTWPVDGREVATLRELRELVWRKLYGEHLAPLFARVLEVTRVNPNLVWTNAAEWVANVSDAADEYLDRASARPFVDDRVALLERDDLPGVSGPNPMRGLIDWRRFDAPDFPHGVQTRHICCVTYLLPDRLGRLCQNCDFLPLEDRVALVRERHGLPMGTPGGPAEKHSIAVGRRKLGLSS